MLDFLKNFPVWKAVSVVVLAALCLGAVKLLLVLFDKFVRKSKIDPIICKILRIAIKAVLLFIAVILVLSSLGISVSSLVAALSIEAGIAHRAAAMTSSHFGTAERQYRFPLEYGGQRAPAAQHTVTASGAVILTDEPHPVQIIGGAFGSIQDQGVNDLNNMGGAMAPAALKLILDYLQETNTKPSDYDLILTGDLGAVGYEIVMDLAQKDGVNLHSVYRDCGVMIYDREKQDMHAGGSGCGCSAAVLTGYVIPKLWRGELQNVLFLSTGALMSPTVSQQGETIPGIAHLLHLKGEKSC